MENRYEKRFWDILEDLFAGAEVEGQSGYVNLLKVKRKYFKNYLRPNLLDFIDKNLQDFSDFKEELYDKLYSFFHRYFSETGSIYFSYTPLYYKLYEKVYHNDKAELKEIITYNTDYEQIISDKEDVSLFWKTHMLYYIKTDKIIRSMKVEFPEENLFFYFDVSEIELKRANEKKELIYELAEIKEDGLIVLKVSYSENGRKTKPEEILKQVKKKYKNITEEILKKAIRTFEKQANVDYFINKNAEKFLKEQFDLWMYQYLFSQEATFDQKRFQQLQALKCIAYKIIEFISQFEDELKKIWEKPRLVFNSNYVITLDRLVKKEGGNEIVNEIIEQLKEQEKEFKELKKELIGKNDFKNQIEEWYILKMIDEPFKVDEILQNGLIEHSLNEKYQFLPIDTKYFHGIKEKIENIFNVYDVNGDLDGRLIKSENWQALNTMLPRFKEEVQTIYIDPPFNTGNDFDYVDRFQDSTWLTLMENRLKLAKEFLKENGGFLLHLDENANYRGRELLDIIFGKTNFRNEIIWAYRTGGAPSKNNPLSKKHDHLLCYSKTEKLKFNKLKEKIIYKKPFFTTEKDEHGNYFALVNLRDFWEGEFLLHDERNNIFEIDVKPVINVSEERVENFLTQKPEGLIKLIILIFSGKNNIVLDFFLGSGTTTAVAHKLKRKWLGIELGGHFYTIILPRMKKVLAYDKTGISKEKDIKENYNEKKAGGFFKYYELEQYEDILKTIDYADTDLKEYYEKLKKVLEEDFTFSNANPFIFDKKLANAIKIEDGKINIDLKSLYPDKEIDIKESLFLQNLDENEKNILKLLYIG
ncbi:adenine-specific DNA-methyltransferase [Nitratiruptor sp. YY08-26]|uniref:DNA methyltransferase n=1 Tax=unclassified Nitratiruptor TaxID=2624044 RepID=UPI0019150EB3|nr:MULTISPECIES: site-specific DNA-methyltransferase [unclassified Nitratiruptor]BCD62899.1 adenine-specific DNA-methyltransferase [Nitratiruptor sp. YY08-13]BCD66834.1 adenine-specific DNA-methyltransferase [Nitratiruptor sp. YY08-26]